MIHFWPSISAFTEDPSRWAKVLSWLLAATIGITIHEFAHAKRADQAGDPTPRANGRLTLNPLAHYDPIGTTMLLLLGFGWAKPVPTNPLNFRRPRHDDIMVALWGPISNIIAAVVFALGWRIYQAVTPGHAYDVLFSAVIALNIILAFFNLIPVSPLDGHHIVLGMLPTDKAQQLEIFYHRFGAILLILVLVFGWRIVAIPINIVYSLLTGQRGFF
jgi:Zn-dependent protease